MHLENILYYTRNFLIVVNIILYLSHFFKRDIIFQALFWYVFISSFKFLPKSHIQEYLVIYLFLQICILSFFYYHLFVNKLQKKMVLVMLIIVFCLCIYSFFLLNWLELINLIALVYTCIIVFMFSIIHFYNSMNTPSLYNYFNWGIFLYLFLTITISVGYETVFFYMKLQNFNTEIFDIMALVFDIMVSVFLIKQFVVLKNTVINKP